MLPPIGCWATSPSPELAGKGGHIVSGYTIRDIKGEDYDQWSALWQGYNAFYGRAGPTAVSDEITQATWSRFFDPDEPVFALVADDQGSLLGLAHFIFHRNTIALGPACYMQDLFTREDTRGQGVGRALIAAVRRRAQAAGAARLYWHTHESNERAMALYDAVAQKSGFIVYRAEL